MRLSRDPLRQTGDDNRILPRTRTCKAVDELKRPPGKSLISGADAKLAKHSALIDVYGQGVGSDR